MSLSCGWVLDETDDDEVAVVWMVAVAKVDRAEIDEADEIKLGLDAPEDVIEAELWLLRLPFRLLMECIDGGDGELSRMELWCEVVLDLDGEEKAYDLPNGDEDWCDEGEDCDNTIDSAISISGAEQDDAQVRASLLAAG